MSWMAFSKFIVWHPKYISDLMEMENQLKSLLFFQLDGWQSLSFFTAIKRKKSKVYWGRDTISLNTDNGNIMNTTFILFLLAQLIIDSVVAFFLLYQRSWNFMATYSAVSHTHIILIIGFQSPQVRSILLFYSNFYVNISTFW
jgi:hypothetical protein